ncbi:MAG: trypsin-like peptidase domain-containing protein [Coriobacteriia bacterium]|nr:trypsin-like peptidase domain-containing protein [Coriobacteriia bacterium]
MTDFGNDPAAPADSRNESGAPDPHRTAAEISREVQGADWHVHSEPEPTGSEGESIAWMADADTHLSDIEAHQVTPPAVMGPLPVCEYTGDDDEPCEEPAVQRRWSSAAVVTAAAVGSVVGGLFVAAGLVWALGLVPGVEPLTASTKEAEPTVNKVTISPGSMADVSEAVAAKVVPSVVNVTVVSEAYNPFTGARVEQAAGNGSGVIVRSDGYILTNNHVIEGADRVFVTVGVDDVPATVVGTDPSSDLAVLKIEGSGYPAIEVGSSKELNVGEYVMAVGSPFGLEKSVTVGIVSALDRADIVSGGEEITTYTNLIQTDAAINPGNSGGALVDDRGRLVGINTLIQSPSGAVGAPQSAGIGFAIPVDFAVDISKQLIANGRAVHPYLGVSTQTVNQSVASQFGLPVTEGALVRFVQPESPAELAGIERGDIIVKIGERTVGGVEDVFAAIRENRVGDEVGVELVRGEARRTLAVTLGSDADRR